MEYLREFIEAEKATPTVPFKSNLNIHIVNA